jgi:hypothetical protein
MANVNFTVSRGDRKIAWTQDSESSLKTLKLKLVGDSDAGEQLGVEATDSFELDGSPLPLSQEEHTTVGVALGDATLLKLRPKRVRECGNEV